HGEPRRRAEMLENLHTIVHDAKTVGNQTKIKVFKTSIGVKDNFLEHFLELIKSSYAKITGYERKQDALDRCMAGLPEDLFSPVWRIAGLDPHSDTPVEILHVILLGFVKYFWRDAVTNQIKKNSPGADTLIARLDSFDVAGLNIPKLSGQTLVQYAGSLTGRDFRAIAQAAPFVLQGLVTPNCYTTWVALSNLIPLVWQPMIPNIDHHITALEAAIQDFLLRVTMWTPRWFNKPKFHILLHLPGHIHRFGPAILFATEGFESFNAVIRAKSIHSNRQAPSRDIARDFAQGSRIRYFMSGGRIHMRKKTDKTGDEVPDNLRPTSIQTGAVMRCIGPGPLSIIAQPNVVTDYLGHRFPERSRGHCNRGPSGPVAFALTQTGQKFPDMEEVMASHRLSQVPAALQPVLLHICESSTLENGDVCWPGSWILVQDFSGAISVFLVGEIVQIDGSSNHGASRPDLFLVQATTNYGFVEPYEMPAITPKEDAYRLMSPA
ncbi:hypothetical protein H0H92_010138, partial [Tricholoma furcatifolium]